MTFPFKLILSDAVQMSGKFEFYYSDYNESNKGWVVDFLYESFAISNFAPESTIPSRSPRIRFQPYGS